jgi:hypothetical protein
MGPPGGGWGRTVGPPDPLCQLRPRVGARLIMLVRYFFTSRNACNHLSQITIKLLENRCVRQTYYPIHASQDDFIVTSIVSNSLTCRQANRSFVTEIA